MQTPVSSSFGAWRALCVAAAFGLVAAGAGVLYAVSVPAASDDALPAPSRPQARSGARCPRCGWIESRRELETDAPGIAGMHEYTVRMADGSSRVFAEPAAIRWRLNERLTFIDGARAPDAPAGAFLGGDATLGPRPALRVQSAAWTPWRDFWFDYESAKLDATDAAKVGEIAAQILRDPALRLGIDDAAGDAERAHQRIDAVRDALIEAGVPAYRIHSGAFGDPLARRERRVAVLFRSER